MKEKKYSLLHIKPDCALLSKKEGEGRYLYKVRDCENDDVFMSYDYNNALAFFNNYDINKVRNERFKAFKNWLSQFVE